MSSGELRKEIEREETWHFLKPEAGDREEPTFLTQEDSKKVKKVTREKV